MEVDEITPISSITDDFYMTIKSSPTLHSSHNKLNNFSVILPNPLYFAYDFEISLCDFIFPMCWNYINNSDYVFYVKIRPSKFYKNAEGLFPQITPNEEDDCNLTSISPINVEEGWILDGDHLANHLNSSLGTIKKTVIVKMRDGDEADEEIKYININLRKHLKFSYNNNTKKFNIHFISNNEYISIKFNTQLGGLLGVESQVFFPKNEKYAGYSERSQSVISSSLPPHFHNISQNEMHIECNEIEQEFIYDRYMGLLNTTYLTHNLNLSNGFGRDCSFSHIRKYKKLKSRFLQTFHFNILNSEFNPFPFYTYDKLNKISQEEIIINLHFRPTLFNHQS